VAFCPLGQKIGLKFSNFQMKLHFQNENIPRINEILFSEELDSNYKSKGR